MPNQKIQKLVKIQPSQPNKKPARQISSLQRTKNPNAMTMD